MCRARILVPQTYHIDSAKPPFRCNASVCIAVLFSSNILPVCYAMLEYQSHTFPHTSGGYAQKLKRYFPFMHIRSDILLPSISFNGRVRYKVQNYDCYSFWNVIKTMSIRFNVRIYVPVRLRARFVCMLLWNSCKPVIQLPTNIDKKRENTYTW